MLSYMMAGGEPVPEAAEALPRRFCLLWSDSVLVQSPACRQWSHSDTLHCPHTSLKGLTAWMRALSSL